MDLDITVDLVAEMVSSTNEPLYGELCLIMEEVLATMTRFHCGLLGKKKIKNKNINKCEYG